tara:strand:- start:37 stop:240 length:204 start_codon:yes stop_codon:yes gene_type:complete
MTPQDLLNETQATFEADIAKRNQLAQQIQLLQNEFNQLAININANQKVIEVLQKVDGVELPETASDN